MRVWVLVAAWATSMGCDDHILNPGAECEHGSDWDITYCVLESNCAGCHGAGATPPELPADLFTDVETGAEYLVVAGDSTASFIWRVVSPDAADRLEGEPTMPYGSAGLPQEQADAFASWIDGGAVLPQPEQN